MDPVTCPQCSRVISPSDTVRSRGIRLFHLDCQNPRALSAWERAVLVYYCWDHVVGSCSACSTHFPLSEIAAADFLDNSTYPCPRCHEDLTDGVRTHLYACSRLPATIRRKAQETREISRMLVKHSRQLCDAADVLVREVEAALDKIQRDKRRSVSERK